MKKILLATILSTLAISSYANDGFNISTHASAEPNCRVDHKCELRGSYDIEITNNTDKEHFYNYSLAICTEYDSLRQCSEKHGTFTISADSTYRNHQDLSAKTIFSSDGYHSVLSVLAINGSDSGGNIIKEDRTIINVNWK